MTRRDLINKLITIMTRDDLQTMALAMYASTILSPDQLEELGIKVPSDPVVPVPERSKLIEKYARIVFCPVCLCPLEHTVEICGNCGYKFEREGSNNDV